MIATVTLNPAVDEFYRVPGFRGGGWFRSGETVRSAGGKGVTMARILKQLGQETLALGFLAGFNGDLLRDCLRREGISTNFVNVPGETRNDVFILNESGHEETMIAEEGPPIGEAPLRRLLSAYDRALRRARYVAMGGSIPPGIDEGIYAELIARAVRAGLPCLLDASGRALERALEARPTIVKADHRFVSEVLGVPLTNLDHLRSLLNRIASYGVLWAVVNYRQYGNLFFSPHGFFLAEIGSEGVVSLFNAGDALCAGLLTALDEKMDPEEAVRFAMACAWANAAHVWSGIGDRRTAEAYRDRVRVERID